MKTRESQNHNGSLAPASAQPSPSQDGFSFNYACRHSVLRLICNWMEIFRFLVLYNGFAFPACTPLPWVCLLLCLLAFSSLLYLVVVGVSKAIMFLVVRRCMPISFLLLCLITQRLESVLISLLAAFPILSTVDFDLDFKSHTRGNFPSKPAYPGRYYAVLRNTRVIPAIFESNLERVTCGIEQK